MSYLANPYCTDQLILDEPLSQRVNGTWTIFEAKLFNLITECLHGTKHDKLYFSARLALCDVARDAIAQKLNRSAT